jgi:hypothetical protein
MQGTPCSSCNNQVYNSINKFVSLSLGNLLDNYSTVYIYTHTYMMNTKIKLSSISLCITLLWYQSITFTLSAVFFSSFISTLPMPVNTTILNTNESHSTLITINVATQTPVKLTSTNYLAWKLQF